MITSKTVIQQTDILKEQITGNIDADSSIFYSDLNTKKPRIYNNTLGHRNLKLSTKFPFLDNIFYSTNNYIGGEYSNGDDVKSNSIFLVPFIPEVDIIFNQIGVEITRGVFNQSFKIIIYKSDIETGWPSSLFYNGNELPGSNNGFISESFTNSIQLESDTIWWFGIATGIGGGWWWTLNFKSLEKKYCIKPILNDNKENTYTSLFLTDTNINSIPLNWPTPVSKRQLLSIDVIQFYLRRNV